MRVLVACEYSGRVRDAFIKKGHEVVSCDFLPTDSPGPHYQGDVKDILYDGWDLMIAHPSCTYLANSGVCHLHTDKYRWAKLDEAGAFFKLLLDAPIPKKVVENPIPHRYAVERIGRKYDQIIHPWQHGHPEKKATCLWLEGLQDLKESSNVKEEMERLPKNIQQRLHYLPPGPDRWKIRSTTFQGIADALAEQYG